ncbi:hypothetical protein N0V82_010406 [Gnomoniopsis sp. IMI 355080]|nr:hypothetical protein N0V82_010406 [Gnomoniopsis sp. IMI 355080]
MSAASPSPEYLAEDIGYTLLNTTYTFIVLITLVYGLFVVSRLFCTERNGWEIWTIYPVSYVFCLTLCISCILFQKLADAGRHTIYVVLTDPGKVETWLKIQTADEALYMTGVTLPKVGLLVLFLHIFVEKRIRVATKILLAVVVLHWLVSGIIVMFTICQPFSFKWDKSIDGHCADLLGAYRYISIPNILTDLAILILHLSTLWHLNMSPIRKAGLFLTFLAGGLTDFNDDFTYLGVYTMIYTEAEACAYFICSCLPGIRPLVRSLYHKSGLNSALSTSYEKGGSTSDKYLNPANTPLVNLNPKAHHTATISTGHISTKPRNFEGDGAFIRLEESFHVSHSSDPKVRDVYDVV